MIGKWLNSFNVKWLKLNINATRLLERKWNHLGWINCNYMIKEDVKLHLSDTSVIIVLMCSLMHAVSCCVWLSELEWSNIRETLSRPSPCLLSSLLSCLTLAQCIHPSLSTSDGRRQQWSQLRSLHCLLFQGVLGGHLKKIASSGQTRVAFVSFQE